MTAEQSKFYDLGRQAQAAGYTTEACNLSIINPMRAWWVAGHIDAAIEAKARAA